MDEQEQSRAARLLGGNPLLYGVAAIGFSVSFETIAHLATRHGLPGWPVLYPLGIDVGIMALIVESRHLIRLGKSDAVPRLLAWLLTAMTVYANVHGSAAHDWAGRALHAVMPCLWVVGLELTRRRMIASEVRRRDKVPLARWLLAPLPTFRLWRWMVLWQITSYPLALEREQVRRRAIATLRARHGAAWRARADSAVVWQLVHGIDVEGASASVSAVAPTPAQQASQPPSQQASEKDAQPTSQPPAGKAVQKPAEKEAEKEAQQASRKPSKAQAKRMSGAELAAYVGTMLEANPGLTQQAVMEELHVGIGKAREALRVAKRDRTVVPLGTRRSSGE